MPIPSLLSSSPHLRCLCQEIDRARSGHRSTGTFASDGVVASNVHGGGAHVDQTAGGFGHDGLTETEAILEALPLVERGLIAFDVMGL
jgi:hypothetical protein